MRKSRKFLNRLKDTTVLNDSRILQHYNQRGFDKKRRR